MNYLGFDVSCGARQFGVARDHRSHSLMDRMPVCGIGDSGSIPGESTSIKMSTHPGAIFVRALTEQSGRLFGRNRSPIEIVLERSEQKYPMGILNS